MSTPPEHATDHEREIVADTTERREPASAKVLTTADGRHFVLYRGSREVTQYFYLLPGARVYDSGCTIALPLTRDVVMALEVFGDLEEADEAYVAAARELLCPSERATSLYPTTAAGAPDPRPHQVAAFSWCLDALIAGRVGALNACCMGSGKTRMAIDFMRHFAKTCSLVIGQKTTLEQWREELARAWPEAEAHVLHQVGTLPERKVYLVKLGRQAPAAPQVVLVNWETVAGLQQALRRLPKFDVVVADEASRLLGRTTAMARAAKQLAWKHAYFRLALTGTPIRRGVEDLLALFQFIDTGVFGSRIADFRKVYCQEVWRKGQPTSIPRQDKVVDLVRQVYSAGYRISRAAVDLPEPEHRTVRLTPSVAQSYYLRRAEADWRAISEVMPTGDQGGTNVLVRILRMQQITAGFVMTVPDEQKQQLVRLPYPLPLDDPKADWIEAYLADVLPTDDAHVIVWTKFVPEIEALYHRLADAFPGAVARIDGATPDAARQETRHRFNDRADPLRVLVMNLQTGALGLDLPACDVMLYHSHTYSYVDRVQSEGRGTRLGRTKPCQVVDLILAGTIDEDIMEAIAQKQAVSDLLIGQGFARRLRTQQEQ